MYRTKNDDTTLNLYINYRMYQERCVPFARMYPNFVDFNKGEKMLYGRVDQNYVPIKVYTPVYFSPLLDAPATTREVSTKIAFNFVVEAFSELQKHFAKHIARGTISSQEKYLSNLKAYRAFESPRETYQRYLKVYNEVLVKQLRAPHIKILDFPQFVRELKILLFKGANEYPFTEAGFVKSRLASIFITGLAVEIADLKYENDEDKLKYFLDSKNWEFYLRACNNFGFMVDRNIPWRLVADLNSPIMRQYSGRFNRISNAKKVFIDYYSPVAQPSYLKFKNHLFDLYKGTKKQGWTEAEYCDGKYINVVVKPKIYSPTDFFDEFDLDYFLPLYMELRFAETEVLISDIEMKNLIHELHEQSKLRGVQYSLLVLERFLGKPFDYSGSVDYYMRKLKILMSDMQQQSEQSTTMTSDGGTGGGY